MRSTPPSALLISPYKEDHQFLRNLLAEQEWKVRAANSIASASPVLREPPSLVITEADLPVGTWKDVPEIMAVLPNPPPVIVASTNADAYLWVEALNLGAHDVLAKPFDKTEVVRVTTAARMHSQRTRPKSKASIA